MKILFCNTREKQCGIYQYGRCLFDLIVHSKKIQFIYDEPTSLGDVNNWVEKEGVGMAIINWHPGIAGWQQEFERISKPLTIPRVLIYHDWIANEKPWDAILFSDPTLKDHDKWFSIPRPIPQWLSCARRTDPLNPVIGVHGFYGASAHYVTKHVIDQFQQATIRLHSAPAHYGDDKGEAVTEMVGKCVAMLVGHPGIKLDVSRHFMTMPQLLEWLEHNDMNCYLRDSSADWMGVSSALDAALAVRRPIAVTYCMGFRHVHGLSPSICIEDRTLKEILETGITPLKPVYAANTQQKMIERVEEILQKVTKETKV